MTANCSWCNRPMEKVTFVSVRGKARRFQYLCPVCDRGDTPDILDSEAKQIKRI